MKEKVPVETPPPPAWKSFLVGMFLLSLVVAPAMGMVFYFSPFAVNQGWYIGAGLPLGFGVGLLVSAVLSAIFAKRASG
jgi:polyferredoxin